MQLLSCRSPDSLPLSRVCPMLAGFRVIGIKDHIGKFGDLANRSV